MRTHLELPFEEWTWREIRDYVAEQMDAKGIAWSDSAPKERSIFDAFLKRYPEGVGPAIATYAFEILGGRWNDHSVTPIDFCKASDKWFGDEIVAMMRRK